MYSDWSLRASVTSSTVKSERYEDVLRALGAISDKFPCSPWSLGSTLPVPGPLGPGPQDSRDHGISCCKAPTRGESSLGHVTSSGGGQLQVWSLSTLCSAAIRLVQRLHILMVGKSGQRVARRGGGREQRFCHNYRVIV